MNWHLFTHLTTDDNAPATGLLCDQPAAPSPELACVLRHLAVLQAVCAAADDVLYQWKYDGETMPEFLRKRMDDRMGKLADALALARAA